MDDTRPDRYVSFKDIPCDDMALKILVRAETVLAKQGETNKFWTAFLQRAQIARTPAPGQDDALKLVCSNSYYLFELFEDASDEEGEGLMEELEYQCC